MMRQIREPQMCAEPKFHCVKPYISLPYGGGDLGWIAEWCSKSARLRCMRNLSFPNVNHTFHFLRGLIYAESRNYVANRRAWDVCENMDSLCKLILCSLRGFWFRLDRGMMRRICEPQICAKPIVSFRKTMRFAFVGELDLDWIAEWCGKPVWACEREARLFLKKCQPYV